MTVVDQPIFDQAGLIPAVVQDAATGDVLMVAWMNAEALERTITTRRTHFWSRARQALWEKGATSGHRQHVEAVYLDCDGDTVLVLVHQEGVACHRGSRTCFVRRVDAGSSGGDDREPRPAGRWSPALEALDRLERTIQARKAEPRPGSYVARLFGEGDAAILKKVAEESGEVIIAALSEGSPRLVAEVADLWFHTLVLLVSRGVPLRAVLAELARRHRPAPTPPDGA